MCGIGGLQMTEYLDDKGCVIKVSSGNSGAGKIV